MYKQRLLLDTGVWISYFGNRLSKENKRIDLAKKIINFCLSNKIELFYCPYVENELLKGKYANRVQNIKKMKKIAKKLPGHIGNDAWEKIDVIMKILAACGTMIKKQH